ncbi:hypothetical protein BVY00_02280 [bacterium G20]|nr:hypothetical protein BVY00_02280 [bacterium G20]
MASSKILLVEDDNNLREIFEMRLQAEGYQTLTASDGEEALVVALREKPELIIADIMMPKMSGFEMLETLRAAPDTSQIKVVMMTALGQAEDQARGEKLGVVKYLVKSQVTLEDFVRVVKEVLQPGGKGASSQKDVAGDDKLTNNKESEKNMPPTDNNSPTNPPAADPAGDTNPISGPASDGQMSTADAQDEVKSQVNDFAGGSSTPASSAGSPPAAGVPDAPAPPSPSPMPEPPTTPPTPDGAPGEGPSTPTPPSGVGV